MLTRRFVLHTDEPPSGGASPRPSCADARTTPGDAACCSRTREEGYAAGVEAGAGGVGCGRWRRSLVDSEVRQCAVLVNTVVLVNNVVLMNKRGWWHQNSVVSSCFLRVSGRLCNTGTKFQLLTF